MAAWLRIKHKQGGIDIAQKLTFRMLGNVSFQNDRYMFFFVEK